MNQGVKLTIKDNMVEDLIKLYEEVDGRKYSDEEKNKLREEFKKLNENGGLGTLY